MAVKRRPTLVLLAVTNVVVLAAGVLGALRQPTVTVTVRIPAEQVSTSGEIVPEFTVSAAGTGTATILSTPAASGTPAAGRVSFGRGYGGLAAAPAPFSSLRVKAGAVVWACAGPDPIGHRTACPPGPRFRTLEEAVIRPGGDDCFFACNASSPCVPVVALAPGELGNVPWGHDLSTDAVAHDGGRVFVQTCGDMTGGSGPATEEARAQARAQMRWSQSRVPGPVVEVERVKEEVFVFPTLDYPPKSVRVTLRVDRGQVPTTQLDDRAMRALTGRAGADREIERSSVHVETRPDADRFVLVWEATARARPVARVLRRTITRAIAGAPVADARRRLVEEFGATEVRIDGRDTLPAARDLRVQIRS